MRVARGAARRRALRTAAAVTVAALSLAGCGLAHLQDLSFRVDNRLHFTTPANRSKVHQPVRLAWTIRDFRIVAPGSAPPAHDAGYFAIFVDRTPVRPGQSLRAVADGDQSCKRDPKCPDAAYFAQNGVFTTTATSFVLPQIANVTGNNDKVQAHTITVILLDTTGHRIGESAWELDLRIPRVGLS